MENSISETQFQLERLVDDPEIRRAAAKTLKGFCLTYLPHHFPLDLSDLFDELCVALESCDIKRLEGSRRKDTPHCRASRPRARSAYPRNRLRLGTTGRTADR